MGSLTVHVVDDEENSVPGKKVFCNFPGIFPTHSEEYTDDDGVAEFDDVPVGTVQVYVNGDLQIEIGVGQNDDEDVTVSI
jgi:hypothetical protein